MDAHVHFHPCFDAARFLTASYQNFLRAARQLEASRNFVGFLLLTEVEEMDWFGELARARDSHQPLAQEYYVCSTSDDCTLEVRGPGGLRLNIVAGRQIQTEERLEVLALGTFRQIDDGWPVAETLQHIREIGAIPVLPWGFGKWLGARGQCVRALVGAASPGTLFLGDNSGRPIGTPDPAPFRLGKRKGIAILPGSDPLPFPSEYDRAGRTGFVLEFDDGPSSACDWSHIRRRIFQLMYARRFGPLERPLRFLRNQAAMQLRARSRT